MIPKRKFIKKQFLAPETNLNEQGINLPAVDDLIEQLKSEDCKVKAGAVAALANLQNMDNNFEEQIYCSSTLTELIKILTTSTNNSLVQTTLFAINNLCINETESNPIQKTVRSLFELKLDKALLQLESSNGHLIKAILILMGNISDYIPKQHRYLLVGIQNTLVVDSEKYLKTSKYYDLVIEFLMKSKYSVDLQKITPPQQKCLQLLKVTSEIDKMYRNRAMASTTLIIMTQGKNKQCIQIFCNNFSEFITDIDLEKQYTTNFGNEKNQNQDNDQFQDDKQLTEEKGIKQAEENVMDEEESKSKQKKSKKSKRKNNNKEKQTQQLEQLKQNIQPETPYTLFIDALEGIQIMMEFIVSQFEDEENYNDEEEEQEMDEEEEENNGELTKGDVIFIKQPFMNEIKKILLSVVHMFQKFVTFSFVEGQNLIQLLLRMVLMMPNHFTSQTNQSNKIPIQSLILLIQAIIIHQFKLQLKNPHKIPEKVFIFNLTTALQIIFKYKKIINRGIYVELPHLKYNSESNNVETIMRINNQWKSAWLPLLQIYSIFYNPEKTTNVTEAQNRSIGIILKKLIVSIPEIELEEWRGQTIDTLFDIYSNEDYDNIFVELDFIKILGQILKGAGNNNKIKGKKQKKFINDVITDVERFITYKKKNIKL